MLRPSGARAQCHHEHGNIAKRRMTRGEQELGTDMQGSVHLFIAAISNNFHMVLQAEKKCAGLHFHATYTAGAAAFVATPSLLCRWSHDDHSQRQTV